MIPQDLERALRENSGGIPQVITEEKPYWAMLYTVPTFHNPTGRLMSPGELSYCNTCAAHVHDSQVTFSTSFY